MTSDHVAEVVDEAARLARARRAGSDGRASRESTIAAVRAIFTRAHKAGLVPSNPALLIDRPVSGSRPSQITTYYRSPLRAT